MVSFLLSPPVLLQFLLQFFFPEIWLDLAPISCSDRVIFGSILVFSFNVFDLVLSGSFWWINCFVMVCRPFQFQVCSFSQFLIYFSSLLSKDLLVPFDQICPSICCISSFKIFFLNIITVLHLKVLSFALGKLSAPNSVSFFDLSVNSRIVFLHNEGFLLKQKLKNNNVFRFASKVEWVFLIYCLFVQLMFRFFCSQTRFLMSLLACLSAQQRKDLSGSLSSVVS